MKNEALRARDVDSFIRFVRTGCERNKLVSVCYNSDDTKVTTRAGDGNERSNLSDEDYETSHEEDEHGENLHDEPAVGRNRV